MNSSSEGVSLFADSNRVRIPNLDPSLSDLPILHVEAAVALIWPYSSSSGTLSLLLAEKDIRLRKSKGQLKVTFEGQCAREVAKTHVGIGDVVKLGLQDATWKHTGDIVSTPGKKIEWDLGVRKRVRLEVQRKHETPISLNLIPQTTHMADGAIVHESPKPLSNGINLYEPSKVPLLYKTPTRISSGSLINTSLSPFAEEDGYVSGRGRKRTKFARHSGAWKLLDDAEEENVMTEILPLSPTSTKITPSTGVEKLVAATPTADLEPARAESQIALVPSPLQEDVALKQLDTQLQQLHAPPGPLFVETARPVSKTDHDVRDSESPINPPPVTIGLEEVSLEYPPLSPVSALQTVPSTSQPLVSPLGSQQDQHIGFLADIDVRENEIVPFEGEQQIDEVSLTPSKLDNGSLKEEQPLRAIPRSEHAAAGDMQNKDGSMSSDLKNGMTASPAIVDEDEMSSTTEAVQWLPQTSAPQAELQNSEVDLDALVEQVEEQAVQDLSVLRDDDPILIRELQDQSSFGRGLSPHVVYDALQNPVVTQDLDSFNYKEAAFPAADDRRTSISEYDSVPVPYESTRIATDGADAVHESEHQRMLLRAEGEPGPSVRNSPVLEQAEMSLGDGKLHHASPSHTSNYSQVESELPANDNAIAARDTDTDDVQTSFLAPMDTATSLPHDILTETPNQDIMTFNREMLQRQDIANHDDFVREDDVAGAKAIDELLPDTAAVNKPNSNELDQTEAFVIGSIFTKDHYPLSPVPTQQTVQIDPTDSSQRSLAEMFPPTPSLTQKSDNLAGAAAQSENDNDPKQVEPTLPELPKIQSEAVSPRSSRRLTRTHFTPGSGTPGSHYFTPRRSTRVARASSPRLTSELPSEDVHSDPIQSQTPMSQLSPQTSPIRSTKRHVSPLQRKSSSSKGTSTSLSYYPSLSSLDDHYSQFVDVLAVSTAASALPKKAKSGPKDFYTTLHLADSSRDDNVTTTAQIFRPKKLALPSVQRGDSVLLRGMRVQSKNHKMILLSTEVSSWIVFRLSSDNVLETTSSGPPAEYADAEIKQCQRLITWWRGKGQSLYPDLLVTSAANDASEVVPLPSLQTSSKRHASVDTDTGNMHQNNLVSPTAEKHTVHSTTHRVTRSQSRRAESIDLTTKSSFDEGHSSRLEAIPNLPVTVIPTVEGSRLDASINNDDAQLRIPASATTVSTMEHAISPTVSTRSMTKRNNQRGRNRRSESLIHELRDGTTYVDDEYERERTNGDLVHELRDGVQWIDD